MPAAPAGPSLEERIGGQWLNWLGAVTMVVAVGLFLKWAYDMGWITPLFHLPPMAYLTFGWLVGAAFLAGSERLRAELPLYAQGLAGGGIATLYLTTYAGHALYDVLSAGVATVGLMLVGALAITVALRHDSVVIGWIGIVLAYVSPVLLGGDGRSPAPLFLYLTGLNAVVLGISVMRRWPAFRMAAFGATVLLYGLWHLKSYTPLHDTAALTFVGINSLIFLGVLVLHPLVWRQATQDADLAVAVLNPVLAGTTFYAVLHSDHAASMGLVAAAFAGVYWGVARLIRARRGIEEGESGDYLEQLFFATALVFALLAVPLQFKGRAMTAGWALMGAALSVVGYSTDSRRTRVWGAVALVLGVCRLVAVDAWSAPSAAAPFFNERGFSFAVVVLSLAAAAGTLLQQWVRSERADEGAVRGLCVAAFAICTLVDWWMGLDLPAGWAPAGWSAVAGLALAFGWQTRSRELRTTATVFVVPPLLTALAEPIAQAQPSVLPGWAGALLLCLGAAGALSAIIAWAVGAWMLYRNGTEWERQGVPSLVLAANLQALAWLSLEAMDVAGRVGPANWAREASQFGLSAVWVLYGAVSIWIGFRRHLPPVRWGGMALLLAAVGKVYLFDLGFLALGYRVLSFLVLALVLLGVSYLYQQQMLASPSRR
jgi:uncharacterized membrane protein